MIHLQLGQFDLGPITPVNIPVFPPGNIEYKAFFTNWPQNTTDILSGYNAIANGGTLSTVPWDTNDPLPQVNYAPVDLDAVQTQVSAILNQMDTDANNLFTRTPWQAPADDTAAAATNSGGGDDDRATMTGR